MVEVEDNLEVMAGEGDERVGVGVDLQTPGPRVYFNKLTSEPVHWGRILQQMHKDIQRANLIIVAMGGEKIPTHSAWLCNRSQGFGVLVDQLPETENELRVMQNANIIKLAINYIFRGSFRKGVTSEELLGLLEFDGQVFTAGLREKVASLLTKRIRSNNVLKVYNAGKKYDLPLLRENAEAFLFRNAKRALEEEDFVLLDKEAVEYLIQKDEIDASEVDIFNALIRWGHGQFMNEASRRGACPGPTPLQLRSILGSLLPLVRFPLMQPQEISQDVYDSGVLNGSELLEIYRYVNSPADAKPHTRFLTTPRDFGRTKLCPSCGGRGQPIKSDPQDDLFHPEHNPPLSGVQYLTQEYLERRQMSGNEQNRERPANEHDSNTGESAGPCKLDKRRRPSGVRESENALEYYKHDTTYVSWEEFVTSLATNPNENLQCTSRIKLKNINFQTNYPYPKVCLDNLKKLNLDVNIDVQDIRFNQARFERTFDIRRFLFFRKSSGTLPEIPLKDLWNEEIQINIVINGVTMLKMDHRYKTLVIGFRNESSDILCGVTGQLHNLSLIKTDVPNITKFPCKHIKEAVLYHLWTTTEHRFGEFVRKCTFLQTLSAWIICPWWEHAGCNQILYSPSILDLAKDLVSDQLQHIALCKIVLHYQPGDRIEKKNLTQLHLDNCYWPDSFPDKIAEMCPNLEKISIKGPEIWTPVRQNYKFYTSVRMLSNILFKLPKVEWVRIFMMDWEDLNLRDEKPHTKNLRSTSGPVTEEELQSVKNVLTSSNLPDDCYNFILKRTCPVHPWKGILLNEKEPQEYDTGYWDFMDKLDYDYFKMASLFENYKNMQNNFQNVIDLP